MDLTEKMRPLSERPAAVAQEVDVGVLAARIEEVTRSLGRLVSAVGDSFSEVLRDIRDADVPGLQKFDQISRGWHSLSESDQWSKQPEIANELSLALSTTGNKVKELLSETISQLTPSPQNGNSEGKFASLERSLADWIETRSQFIDKLGSKLNEGQPVCDFNRFNDFPDESISQFRNLLTQLSHLSADIYRNILTTEVASASLYLRDFLQNSGRSVQYTKDDAFGDAAAATRIATDLLKPGPHEDTPLGRYESISVGSAVARLANLVSTISEECRHFDTQKKGLSGSERTVAEILTELAASSGNVKHLITALDHSSKFTRLEHTLEQISKFGRDTKHFTTTDNIRNHHAQRINNARDELFNKLKDMALNPTLYLTGLGMNKGISESIFYRMILPPLCAFGASGLEEIKKFYDLASNSQSSAALKEVCLDVLTSELRDSSCRDLLLESESIWFAGFANHLKKSNQGDDLAGKFVKLAQECSLISLEDKVTIASSH
jgi:hypothetical protein